MKMQFSHAENTEKLIIVQEELYDFWNWAAQSDSIRHYQSKRALNAITRKHITNTKKAASSRSKALQGGSYTWKLSKPNHKS